MKYILTLLVVMIVAFDGATQESKLSIFDNLIDKCWLAEGKWGDGSDFKQEICFQYDLGAHIVTAKANGFTNQEQTEYGKRNFGVRKFDPISGKVNFWEFDAFGGLTVGEVKAIDKNIHYRYQYGDMYVTDMWEYVNDSTYKFRVGDYKEGEWKQTYLETTFNQIHRKTTTDNFLKSYSRLLNGSWKSKAWDGELIETWSISPLDGHLTQNAEYYEQGVLSYQAMNKMEVLNGELILFTVINGSNPKIFKATSIAHDKVVFENSDYANPSRVEYIFLNDGFQRIISGDESGKPTTYTFDFSRTD